MVNLQMPEIETSRLYLRGLELADAIDIYEYYHLAEATCFLSTPRHRSVDETLHMLQAYELPYNRRNEPQTWVLEEKASGRVIGHMCIHTVIDDYAEIAYILHPAYWHQGYINEALPYLLEVGFTQLQLRRLTAYVAIENRNSIHVLERAGFRYEGTLKEAMRLSDGKYHDMMLFAILKREWRKKHEKDIRSKI